MNSSVFYVHITKGQGTQPHFLAFDNAHLKFHLSEMFLQFMYKVLVLAENIGYVLVRYEQFILSGLLHHIKTP